MKPSVNDNNISIEHFTCDFAKNAKFQILYWDIFVFGQSGHIDKKKPFLWMLMRQTERRGVNIYWMIAHSLAPLNVRFLFLYRTHLHIGYDHWVDSVTVSLFAF